MSLGDKGVTLLCDALYGNEIILALLLKDNELTANSMGAIVNLVKQSSIEHLELSKNPIGNAGVTRLSDCIASSRCNLKILELADCNLTSAGCIPFLQSMKINGSIVYLNMNKNDFSGKATLKWKEMLHGNKSLNKISLVKCKLGDYGASMIAKGYYRNNYLTHINLRGNHIGNVGAESFVRHLKGFKENYMKSLNLSNNLINEITAMKLISAANPIDRPVCHLGT